MELIIPDLSYLEVIDHIEKTCFPLQEAASKTSLKQRIETYPQGYRLCKVEDKIVGYLGGLKTNQTVIDDKMYEDTSYHETKGKYQMIFSVCILPEYQGKGYGKEMLLKYIEEIKKETTKGIILTCKDHLRPFYESCGFKWMQVSKSSHGGAKWNDMILRWNKL